MENEDRKSLLVQRFKQYAAAKKNARIQSPPEARPAAPPKENPNWKKSETYKNYGRAGRPDAEEISRYLARYPTLSYSEVGAVFKATRNTIRTIAVRFGVERKKPELSSLDLAIEAKSKEGKTPEEIAKELEISLSVVYHRLRKVAKVREKLSQLPENS